jgi:hypothetical protein
VEIWGKAALSLYMWPLMGFPHISTPRHISKGEQERDLPFLRSPRQDISVKESKRDLPFLRSPRQDISVKESKREIFVANLHQWEIMSWHDMRCQKACKNMWRAFLICKHTIWWFCVVFMPLPTYPLFFHQLKSFK